jgi:drug/metabolite transporter (DMT)-like permease
MPLSILAVLARYALSALVMLAVWPRLRDIRGLELAQGFGLGIFHGAGLLLQNDGLAHTDASISAFLTQCYCVLLPLYAAFARRLWPDLRTWTCVVLVMVGVGLLSGFDPRTFRLGRGEAETLLCSIFFTAQILWLERPRYAGNRYQPVTLIMFATVAAMLVPLLLWQAPSVSWVRAALAPAPVFPLLAALVLICTVAATLLMNRWQRHVTSTEAGLLYSTEPVYACIIALFLPAVLAPLCAIDYPNELLTWRLVIGGALILAANAWMQHRPAPAG